MYIHITYIISLSIAQELLRTLTYVNRASEPSLSQRTITVFIRSPNDTQSCNVLVSIEPVNDNLPVVDLSGPSIPSINHTVEVNYTFVNGPSSEWISSRDATISDQDQNALIESLTAELVPRQPGDRIFLSDTLGCSHGETSICLLK